MVRWLIIVFILISASLVDFQPVTVHRIHIITSVAVIALLTVISQLVALKWQLLRKPILTTIADIFLVTVVLYFSDGIQSPFYPLYYIVVITTAAEYGLYGAIIGATVIAVLSVAVDIISPGIKITEGFVESGIMETVPYLFLIALITGALRNRIRVLDETAASLRADRAATEKEMEVAARMQRAQLPRKTPSVEGIHIAITYKPAREVGGDIYDFYPAGKDAIGVMIADVSGKGVPAALLIASTKYAVRECYSDNYPLMFSKINKSIDSITPDDTFVTMIYGILNPRKLDFRYINAGHMPPIIVKGAAGEVVVQEHYDPPLGITHGKIYSEYHLNLEHGDTLVLYTDGVTDGLASTDLEGLTEFMAFLKTAGNDVESWGEKLLSRVNEPRHLDDITMIAIKIE